MIIQSVYGCLLQVSLKRQSPLSIGAMVQGESRFTEVPFRLVKLEELMKRSCVRITLVPWFCHPFKGFFVFFLSFLLPFICKYSFPYGSHTYLRYEVRYR